MAAPERNSGSREPTAARPAERFSRATAAASRRGTWRGVDQASVMVVELLSGLLLWGGIGWFVGTRFGGHPWPFIIGSLLGFAGGFYLLWLRAEGRIGGSRPSAALSTGEEAGDADEVDSTARQRADAETGPDTDGEPDRP